MAKEFAPLPTHQLQQNRATMIDGEYRIVLASVTLRHLIQKTLFIGFLLVLLFVLPSEAIGARPATHLEEEGMIRSVEAYVHDGDQFTMEFADVTTHGEQWAYGVWEDHLPEFPSMPLKQNVVFQRLVGTEWRVARYPTGVCGIAYEEPIPKAVQIDLRLPSCLPSYGLIDHPALIRDSTQRFMSEPSTIKVESPSVTWYLTGMHWKYWNFNRSGRAESSATWRHRTCTPDCESGKIVEEAVELTLSDPVRCQGRWVYGEANWYSAARGHETHGPFRFPCHGPLWR